MKKYYERHEVQSLPILQQSGAVEVGTDKGPYLSMRFDVRQDGSLFIVSHRYILNDNPESDHIPSQFCPVFLSANSAKQHLLSLAYVVANYDDVCAYRESIGDPLKPADQNEAHI